jgi:hypothetical protein
MTLTISQLQHMYGTTSVKELRGASLAAPSVKTKENLAISQPEDSDFALADDMATPRLNQFKAVTSIPDEQNVMLMSPEQRGAMFKKHEAERLAKIEERKAALPPRIKGALGEDLRLSDRYSPETANFLEEMKVKYAHMKDALYVPEENEQPRIENNVFGEDLILPTKAQMRERDGNHFVINLAHAFSHIASKVNQIYTNRSIMKDAQNRLPSGSSQPLLQEQIASHEKIIAQAKKELRDILAPLHENLDPFDAWQEVRAFFADYAEFAYGERYDLNAAYHEAGLKLTSPN